MVDLQDWEYFLGIIVSDALLEKGGRRQARENLPGWIEQERLVHAVTWSTSTRLQLNFFQASRRRRFALFISDIVQRAEPWRRYGMDDVCS